MDKFCIYCGCRLNQEDEFCINCGNPAIEPGPGGPVRIDPSRNRPAPYEQPDTRGAGARVNKTQEFLERRRAEAAAGYPRRNGSRQSAPKKGGGGKAVIAVILILAILGGVLFAGFKYPGFFLKEKDLTGQTATVSNTDSKPEGEATPGPGNDEDDGSTENDDDDREYENYEISAVVSADDIPVIRPFSEADITFTEEEIAQAPAAEASVSIEDPVVTCGSVSVDFKGWNLENDEDTLVVKELPAKTDEEAGYTITAYDFSMASGQHEFLTDVTIRIPRDEFEDQEGWCVTYNEETKQWESLYSEISEDGAYYEIHTSHFSLDGKASYSSNKLKELAREKKKNPGEEKTKDYLCTFYYPYHTSIAAMKDTPVTIDFDYFWNRVNSKYTMSEDELTAWIERTPEDDMAWQSPISQEALLGNADGGYATFSLFGGEDGLKAGTKAAGKYASDLLIQGDQKGFLAAKIAGRLGGMVRHTGRAVGYVNTLYNLYATPAKIMHEVKQGKTTWQAANNHKLDIIGTAAGSVGLLASAGLVAAGPITVGAAVVGAGVWITSVIYSAYAPADLGVVEQVYRDYYVEESADGSGKPTARTILYDTRRDPTMLFGNVGVMDALPSLTEEENTELHKILKDGLLAFNPRAYGAESMFSGPTNTEDRLKLQRWVLVLKFLFKCSENDTGRLMNLISEFYTSYAEACWKSGEADFSLYAAWDMNRRSQDASKFKMPDEATQKQYTENLVTELMRAHKDILEAIVKQYDDAARKATEDFIRDEELPYLNTRMEFRVTGLENTPFAVDYTTMPNNQFLMEMYIDEDDDYRYSDLLLPMRFANKIDGQYYEIDGPAFLPYYENSLGQIVSTKTFDFWPQQTGFIPRYTGGDLVFTCTYYYYLMMGAPNTMVFTNTEGMGYCVPVDFEVTDSDSGTIVVNIEPPTNDMAKLEGSWGRTVNGSEYENERLEEVSLSVQDGGGYNIFTSQLDGEEELFLLQRHEDDYKFYYNEDIQVMTIWKKATGERYDYTVDWKTNNVIYLEELNYYLEREGIPPGDYTLYLDDESRAMAKLSVYSDGTLLLEVPGYEYTNSGNTTTYTYSSLTIRAKKSDMPDVPYGYDVAVGKHFVVTECSESVTWTSERTNSKGEKETKTVTYTDMVVGEDNLPASSYVLLYYDNKDMSKLSFVQFYLLHKKHIENGKEKDVGYTPEYYKQLVF